MPATKSKKCQSCDGEGIVTVTRHVRKKPDITNEGICLTCLGTGKDT